MKYIKLCILLIFSILFLKMSSATIVSMNSAGSQNVVEIPNKYIEGFFFGIDIPPPQPGGGSPGGGRTGDVLDYYLCRRVYDYLEYRIPPTLTQLIENLTTQNETLYPERKIILYSQTWQERCSIALNKTLNESYICAQVEEFRTPFISTNTSYGLGDLQIFHSNVIKSVPISTYLLNYYILNYDKECLKQEPYFEPIKEKNLAIPFLLGFLIFILLLIIIAITRRRRKDRKKRMNKSIKIVQ